MPGKDFKNQLGSIPDHAVKRPLDVLALPGGKVVVKDYQFNVVLLHEPVHILKLAASDIGARFGRSAGLNCLRNNRKAEGLCQVRHLRQRLGCLRRSVRRQGYCCQQYCRKAPGCVCVHHAPKAAAVTR